MAKHLSEQAGASAEANPPAGELLAYFNQLAQHDDHIFLFWSLAAQRFVFVSAGYEKIFGSAPAVLRADPGHWLSRVARADVPTARALLEGWATHNAARAREGEYRVYDADDVQRWVLHRVTGVRNEAGALIGLSSIIVDVSPRVLATEALRLSEEKYRNIFERAGIGIFQSTVSGRFLNLNSALARMLGYASPLDAINNIDDIRTQVYADPDSRHALLDALYKKDGLTRIETRVRRRNAAPFYAQIHARLAYGEDGAPLYLEGFVEDVNERRMAQDALARSQQRLRQILDQLPAVVWTTDRRLVFTSSRGAGLRAIGLDTDQVVGQRLADYFGESPNFEEVRAHHEEALNGGSVNFEVEWADRVFQAHVEPLLDRPGAVASGVIGVAIDVTARRALEEERDRLFNLSTDLMLVVELRGPIRQVNRAWTELLQWTPEELQREQLLGLMHPDDTEAAEQQIQRLEKGEPVRFFEVRMRRKDGAYRLISWNAFSTQEGPLAYAVGRDITERRRLQSEQRELERHRQQTEKLESLGVLAGGIAHDFNNMLTAVLGHAQMAAMRLPQDAPVQKNVAEIERAARRASEVTREMLAYAGRERGAREPLCLTKLVRDMANLLESSVPRTTQLHYDLSEDLPRIEGTSAELWQVIIRLVMSGSEALAQRPGEVFVRTGEVELGVQDLQRLQPPDTLEAAPAVYLEVADTASRHTGDLLAELGLAKAGGSPTPASGLATVQAIVRAHEGALEARTDDDGHAAVRVYLPPIGTRPR